MGLLSTLFGKRRRRVHRKKKSSKPTMALRKLCKKLNVRLTVKRGSKRVYKSEKMLRKQCKNKAKILKHKHSKKASHARKHRRTRKYRRRSHRFGLSPASTSTRNVISSGAPGYSSQVKKDKGLYGVGKAFFGDVVPNPMSPSWYSNIQPDGANLQVGWPFGSYKKPQSKYV